MHVTRYITGGRSVLTTGFTLVETLVVIGIIAILLGLLLPALSRAKESSERTKCLANIKQLAQAFTLYAQDYDGYGPDEYAESTWDALIYPYLSVDEVYLCPSDEDEYDDDFGTSYEWRDSFAVALDCPECALSGKDMLSARPSTLVLLFDAVIGWHAPDTVNVALLDGASLSMSAEDFWANMEIRVQ